MLAANFSSSWLAGFTVLASLIISIGAQNLYVLRQAVQGEHVRACVAWCVTSDVLLVVLGVAGMSQMMQNYPELSRYLTLGGAAFLLVYGLFALWRMYAAPDVNLQSQTGKAESRSLRNVLTVLVALTLLNPHVYLDTVLLAGSIGARQEGVDRWSYVLGAACASLSWFVLLAFAGRRMKHLFEHPKAWRIMDGVTALMMLGLAWWVAGSALEIPI